MPLFQELPTGILKFVNEGSDSLGKFILLQGSLKIIMANDIIFLSDRKLKNLDITSQIPFASAIMPFLTMKTLLLHWNIFWKTH